MKGKSMQDSTVEAKKGTLVLETVQWGTLTHVDEVEPISEKDYKVLEELGAVLGKYGYHNRFGISLIHKHFEVNPGEIAMEETDEEARVSTIKVVPDSGDANTIGTQWRFGQVPGGPTMVTKCVLRCHYDSGHKQRHRREGH